MWLLLAGIVAAGVSVWSSYQGLQANQDQANQANTQSRSYADQANAFEKQKYADSQTELNKEWAWKEQDQDYQRKADMSNRMMSAVMGKPALEDQLIRQWSR